MIHMNNVSWVPVLVISYNKQASTAEEGAIINIYIIIKYNIIYNNITLLIYHIRGKGHENNIVFEYH